MRKSMYDDFIYYNPINDRLVHVCRDIKWGKVWDYFHYDGVRSWNTRGFDIPELWILIDRLPGGSLWGR